VRGEPLQILTLEVIQGLIFICQPYLCLLTTFVNNWFLFVASSHLEIQKRKFEYVSTQNQLKNSLFLSVISQLVHNNGGLQVAIVVVLIIAHVKLHRTK
jgi:hypothetical protein